MTRFSALTILTILLLAGCASRLTTDDFYSRDEELASVYYTGTKEEADASLRKLLVLIEETETAGLKAADYDKFRFFIHLQLSRLASAMKNEALARSEMNQAISCFRRAHADTKQTDAELARALTELADAVEKEKTPAWRKEPNSAGSAAPERATGPG